MCGPGKIKACFLFKHLINYQLRKSLKPDDAAIEFTDFRKRERDEGDTVNTILGDIKGNEGVYGLQRALMMAGVKYIIMSLWQIPDKETVEFMGMFYNNLLTDKDIKSAFYKTRKLMRTKYDPYFWGAFVLLE